jgi:hypothetical protein
VLYYGADGTLLVGRWGTDVKLVSQLAFFKFGSVVGLGSSGAYTVKFNPTGNNYANQVNVPKFDYADSSSDWDTSNSIGATNVSASRYHKVSNIMAGKGDPCQLVGFKTADFTGQTEAEIATILAAKPPKWFLPTLVDNALFIGMSATPSNPMLGESYGSWSMYN